MPLGLVSAVEKDEGVVDIAELCVEGVLGVGLVGVEAVEVREEGGGGGGKGVLVPARRNL